jgi:hypothetical protein
LTPTPRNRRPFDRGPPTWGMSDTDLLGIVLASIVVLMFATGILLAV